MQILVRLTIFVLSMFMLGSCSNGWSIAGFELTPQDTTRKGILIELMDRDSILHCYHSAVTEKDNWCYYHLRYEDVKSYVE